MKDTSGVGSSFLCLSAEKFLLSVKQKPEIRKNVLLVYCKFKRHLQVKALQTLKDENIIKCNLFP